MASAEIIDDRQLRSIYDHWAGSRLGKSMPARRDIDPLKIPARAWPHTMLLDVVREGGGVRFRYRRVGDVFWRAAGTQPCGRFVDEILPETADYQHYVIGIYDEIVECRRPLYTENRFALHGHATPILAKRIMLPLSNDDQNVDMILAGHIFDYGAMRAEEAFPLVYGLQPGKRTIIDD
jgi:hypothetical protein